MTPSALLTSNILPKNSTRRDPPLRADVCCGVLQCGVVCCSQCFVGVALTSDMLQCVAVCCSVLQRVAVCCSVLTSDMLP